MTYTDHISPPKQLIFETSATRDEIYQFYRDTLGRDGWEPTTEKPITGEYKAFMIFRNKAKDLMELETENPQQGRIRGFLKHQSAAEVAHNDAARSRLKAEGKKERDAEAAKEAQREKERKDKKAAEQARRRVVLAAPGDAKGLKFEADGIKFNTRAEKREPPPKPSPNSSVMPAGS